MVYSFTADFGLFFKICFYFGIILDLYNICKDTGEFSYTAHSGSPLCLGLIAQCVIVFTVAHIIKSFEKLGLPIAEIALPLTIYCHI